MVKDSSGQIVTNTKEIKQTWREHTETLWSTDVKLQGIIVSKIILKMLSLCTAFLSESKYVLVLSLLILKKNQGTNTSKNK